MSKPTFKAILKKPSQNQNTHQEIHQKKTDLDALKVEHVMKICEALNDEPEASDYVQENAYLGTNHLELCEIGKEYEIGIPMSTSQVSSMLVHNSEEYKVVDNISGEGFKVKIKKTPENKIKTAVECIKKYYTVKNILIKQSHSNSLPVAKIEELLTPLYRHSLLVLGKFMENRSQSEDPVNLDITKLSETELAKTPISLLKELEQLYTKDLSVSDTVSLVRVQEIFNPLTKYANLLMGIHSYNMTEERVEILTSVPIKDKEFSKVMKCTSDGTPYLTYHNVKITSHDSSVAIFYIPGRAKYNEISLIEIYKTDLPNWRFVR